MHEYSKRIGEHIKSCYSDFNKMTREELDELKDWACVMKDLTEYDINKRGIEAMDEAEQEEKMYGRMGYRGRAANGRFVHRTGRGRSAGYTPYLHMMEEPDEYDGMYGEMPMMTGYRMGYTDGRTSGNRSDMTGGRSMNDMDRSGYTKQGHGRYGKAYDDFDYYRKHYTESKSPEDKRMMKESMNEIFDGMENVIEDIMRYADTADKPALKQKMVQMAQKVQNMQ